MDKVTVPIVKDLFTLVVRHIGPVCTQTNIPYMQCTDDQDKVTADLEVVLTLHRRRPTVLECFRAALPKGMYWLGTSIMTNHLVATFLPQALQGQPTSTVELPREITSATYSAAVRFMYKRYLAGQAILAVTVNEQSWLARRTPLTTEPGDIVRLLVRIL